MLWMCQYIWTIAWISIWTVKLLLEKLKHLIIHKHTIFVKYRTIFFFFCYFVLSPLLQFSSNIWMRFLDIASAVIVVVVNFFCHSHASLFISYHLILFHLGDFIIFGIVCCLCFLSSFAYLFTFAQRFIKHWVFCCYFIVNVFNSSYHTAFFLLVEFYVILNVNDRTMFYPINNKRATKKNVLRVQYSYSHSYFYS